MIYRTQRLRDHSVEVPEGDFKFTDTSHVKPRLNFKGLFVWSQSFVKSIQYEKQIIHHKRYHTSYGAHHKIYHTS